MSVVKLGVFHPLDSQKENPNSILAFLPQKVSIKLFHSTYMLFSLTGVASPICADRLCSCESIDLDGDNVDVLPNFSSKALFERGAEIKEIHYQIA